MRMLVRAVTALFLFLFLGCATPARVTTEAERASASKLLSLISIAVSVAKTDGKVHQGDYDRAMQTIAQLRQEIEDSATVPLDVSDVLLRIGDLAVAWQVPKEVK